MTAEAGRTQLGSDIGDPAFGVLAYLGMREPLVIAVAQPESILYDIPGNAERHAAAVRECDARVAVFPELSLSGYEMDAPAIGSADRRLAPIIEACRETGSVALVGAPIERAGRSYIAMLAVDAEGAAVVYEKMWLGGDEPSRFTRGEAPAVLDIDGWRLGLAICKDTGVQQHAADTMGLGVDVYVAGVLETAEDAEVQPARALQVATDHGVWVVMASFAGSTGGGFSAAAGGSGVWRPDGSLVAQAGVDAGTFARATVG